MSIWRRFFFWSVVTAVIAAVWSVTIVLVERRDRADAQAQPQARRL